MRNAVGCRMSQDVLRYHLLHARLSQSTECAARHLDVSSQVQHAISDSCHSKAGAHSPSRCSQVQDDSEEPANPASPHRQLGGFFGKTDGCLRPVSSSAGPINSPWDLNKHRKRNLNCNKFFLTPRSLSDFRSCWTFREAAREQ